MAAVEDDSELECRVCRGGPDLPSRPLFSPCLCSGSIGLVHQDCLEAWLKHSGKESCELCKQKYEFDPEYAKDAPDVIPISVLLYSVLKYLPFLFRVIMAIFLWVVFAPWCTNGIYKIWFRTLISGKLFERGKITSFGQDSVNSILPTLFQDCTTGLVLIGVIAISFIVLVSRSKWRIYDCIAAINPLLIQNL